ncbi:hypothetical protein BH09PAT2_BH09PAT2_08530 [soil metagenome]
MNEIVLYERQLHVMLPKRLDFSIVELLSQLLSRISKEIHTVEFDFQNTNFSTLPGVMYLLLFAEYVRNHASHVNVFIGNISHALHKYFLRLNFYTAASSARITIEKEDLTEERKFKQSLSNDNATIIFPISIVNAKTGRSEYESNATAFVNKFSAFFHNMSNSPISDTLILEFQSLYDVLNENVKNIYDHSESKGFASIHVSSFLNGITMAFFDPGIGIEKSAFNFNKLLGQKAIEWALESGSTSKPDTNYGSGFAYMKHYTDIEKGLLTIRTTKYLYIYKNGIWQGREVQFFPGTQIVLFVPINQ